MDDIRSKVAYLHGLAEGLDIDVSSAEGRVLSSMLDVMSELADQITDVAEAQDELAEYVEDVDYDLGALEESIYGDEDDEPEITFIPESRVRQQEDGVDLISCPSCGETLAAGGGDLDEEIDVLCPVCGCSMMEDRDSDEDLVMEHE